MFKPPPPPGTGTEVVEEMAVGRGVKLAPLVVAEGTIEGLLKATGAGDGNVGAAAGLFGDDGVGP